MRLSVSVCVSVWLLLCLRARAGTSDLPGDRVSDTNNTCGLQEFRCDDGRCLASWKCSSINNCEDLCSNRTSCREGEFQCLQTKKCIPIGWQCDGDPDCGIDEKYGLDDSDETQTSCFEIMPCPPNEQYCVGRSQCIPTVDYCNGERKCPQEGDKIPVCQVPISECDKKKCEHACAITKTGPTCYCPEGAKPEDDKCVDFDECTLDFKCDQICKNTIGSFNCSCVNGYELTNVTHCRAINDPIEEEASLIFSTQRDIKRTKLDGTPWSGNSSLRLLNSYALDFDYDNRSICYIHNKVTKSSLSCSSIDNFNDKWSLPAPSLFPELDTIHRIALDWISKNWYFVDDQREAIFLCNSTLDACDIILEVNLSKPSGIALDPTRGVMFFTKWGHSVPALERCSLNGSNRESLVTWKIVHPCGIAVDIPTATVYWIDEYLDFVEQVDYFGNNRRTLKRGHPVQSLYSVTVFELNLFVTSSQNHSIIRLNKPDADHYAIIKGNISQPYSIHVFHRQKQPNISHPCKIHNGGCEHICVPGYKNEANTPYAICMCKPGFRLRGHGECVLVNESTFLIYGKGKPAMIKAISMSPKQRHQMIIPITDLNQPTALDFDFKDQFIYYSDVQKNVIQRQHLNGTGRETILSAVKNGKYSISNCEGIAIDWINNLLYWTDESLHRISVMSLSDFEKKKTLIYDTTSNPRSIVLDPKRGIMFWSHWRGKPHRNGKIESAWMDGTNRIPIVTTDIQWPNGLTIDYSLGKLYWCDVFLDKIERINLDGTQRVIIQQSEKSARPYSLAFHANFLFWTEYNKGTIRRLHLTDNTLDTLSVESPPLFDIKVYEDRTDFGSNDCSSKNCTEFCLATPKGSECSCSDGMMFDSTNSSCIPVQNYTLPSRCQGDGLFQCTHRHCIDQKYVCDGDIDCEDGSDEDARPGGICENIVCQENQFQCDSNRCLSISLVCDGEKDCADGSDEEPVHCHNSTCSPMQFRCKISGRCIPMVWKCDIDVDCGDGDNSDEDASCTYPECEANQFTCDNKECIQSEYYCNGYPDCKDRSDEKNCGNICDPKTMIYCPAHEGCFPIKIKCDGVIDCPDGSDEVDCVAEKIPTPRVGNRYHYHKVTTNNKEYEMCEKNEFQCKNLDCIRKEFRCDTRVDCLDGSDEENCTSSTFSTTTETPSSVLPEPTSPTSCELPSRKCDNETKCITPDKLCDDRNHCLDGSDEGLRCSERLCDRIFDCSHMCYNTPEGFICACPNGLHLQPDGMHCSNYHPCNQWGVCSQKCQPHKSKHKCICNDGYQLANDGFTCKSTDVAVPYVIFSNRHELRSIDLHTMQDKPLIISLKNTIALDFHYTKEANIIYWTDAIDDKIYRGTLVGGLLGKVEVIVQTGLTTAEGLAVDWVAENLYWVESTLDQIEVSKLNGSFRKTLIAGDMESPRAIALDPRHGTLFWTDWETSAPRIERCTLAGRSRRIVVQVDKVSDGAWPNGLTLDYEVLRIYWIDARSNSIHTVTYDGLDHRIILKGRALISHPFAIALYENYVYWTDWRTNSVIRANKWNGSDVFALRKTYTQPFDITIMHPSRQPKASVNPCGNNNGGCSHLCLLETEQSFQCACPHVMILGLDQKNCIVNDKFLLFSRHNEIRGVDLTMPYYHIIPTISSRQILAPQQLDFDAKTKSLYWSDVQTNEIKKTGLTSGPTTSIIDTGIENPSGFAIDWISELMFFSSSGNKEQISVCTLKGEYTTVLISNDIMNVSGISLAPSSGKLFWGHIKNESYVIERSNMDGSDRIVLDSEIVNSDLSLPQSLTYEVSSQRLYWVNINSFTIQYYDFLKMKSFKVPLPKETVPTAAIPYFDKLYYASAHDQAIHSCDKTNCSNDEILRNKTANVLSMRIYDSNLQKGTNFCSKNRGGCQHLCLPTDAYTRKCACATGYYSDPSHPNNCIGFEEFVFYSINWEIKGLKLNGSDEIAVLGPISHVSLATSIDFHAATDHIYWTDSDHGTINRIKRDGTDRQVLIEQSEIVENTPVDWLSGLSIDWIASNMYWIDPKRNVIEVARLNGSSRYVILANYLETPSALAVDPMVGFLFYACGSSVYRAYLDGSNSIMLFNATAPTSITDISLDYGNKKVYWTQTSRSSQSIMEMFYNGSSPIVSLNHNLNNPSALTIHKGYVYWIDTIHELGSIKKAPISNVSNYQVLLKGVGDSLKDIQIFSKQRQKGTNPCAGPSNGGCEKLCLFNGHNVTCACPHGKVGPDGKKCISYNTFLMYSLMVRIESIHMFDENNLNAPYPAIQNRELRNAIALSFDYHSSRLFYSDTKTSTINAVFFNGTGHTVIVDHQGSAEGLAFDPLSKYLFWTCNHNASINKLNLTNFFQNDSPSAKRMNHSIRESFEDISEKKSSVETVIKLETNDKPRGIAIDSCQMKIYWTNWNSHSPSIQRAHTNGYNQESIITTDIHIPNALTLDHKAQKLYWIDARLDKIERTEYDGSHRFIITKGTAAHPFDLAVYGDSIFWTDWELRAVIRADKISGLNIVKLRKDVPRPMGIVAIAEDTDNCMLNPCMQLNGGCSDICSLNAYGEVICKCFPNRHLDHSATRCLESTTNCEGGDLNYFFACTEGDCIPLESTCDGINHCADGSDEDERYCATRKCSEPFHQCNDNRCISFYKVCNGENDCGDGSDEASCSCKDDFFKCNSGQCISADMLCDFKADCPDASDEKNCALTDCFSPRAMAGRTPPDNIPLQRCLYTTPCVHPTWKCDGQNDCLDNSDEENCTISTHSTIAGITCSSDQFKCAFGLCISAQWRCDGEDDCYDGKYSSSGISSDEINCGHQCRPNQFACGSDECIPSNWQCDGSPDCTDASDESTHCSERTCSENEYRCGKTPRCITKAWLCDGEVDCVGGEDENITAGCKPSTCTPHHLQCANGNCISKHYYCDGDNDCGDGSDEPLNCSELDKNEKCEQGKLPCRSGICISESRFCDGWDDCKDGTDEDPTFCNKNGESGYCSVSEFLCSNDLCINNTLICDGQNDCGDFSDEIKCNINECLDSTICAHHCTDLKIGYTCSCRKGYRLAENNKHLCLDIDECMENPCGQICRNTQGSYVCSCQDGFTLNPDKINCRANSRTAATLIFSNRYYIRTMNLANGAPTLIAHNLTNAVALDFDWAGQCVYWSDVTAQGSNIKRLCDMNSTNIEKNNSSSNYQVLHSTNLQNPDGLAVDWIGRNIYWCDKGHDTIEASRLDGRHRKILMNKGLQEPRAIALDPKHGMMYWSDWGDQAHIGRAGMDGSNPTIIINSILGWPNALSISHESRELYFADAKEDYIAVADLDGKNVRFLFSRAKNPSLKLHHIFAIAVWEGYIYWSDWETKTIERCERHVNLKYLRENAANHTSLNQSCRTMAKLIHKPMDIRIYHPYRQRPVPNRSLRCAELNCSGLCLLTPGSDGPIAKCACPESFILADDGFSCNPNCTTAHFVCAKALKCIPFWWRCDTQDDCGDGSDEPETCRRFHCTPGEFQCNGNQCIHPSQLCNGVDDCGDNSDEIDCDKFTCLSSQFKCKGNGTVSDRCIPSSERCDGHNNCPNGEDEIDCPSETCSPGHFVCNNSKCIPKVWLCDKDNDCGDNSDETVQCEERKCPADLFRCQSGRCIPQSWQCDGEKDCPDGEDEPLSCDPQTVCEPTYFKCKNNKCIPGRWHCDYEDDCGDKSDEINCVPRNCSESEYRCADGQCVRGTHRCDGQYNCHDRSDELGCNILCNAFEFQCQDPKTCILSEWRCDGDIDCSDGSDEFGCKIDTNRTSVSPCEPHMFFCPPPQGRCIPNDWLCDAALDCIDGSDENDSMCSLRACLPSTQRCNNHKCIPTKYWCDGTDDCGDGSDENSFICKNSNLCAKDQFKCSNTYCIAKNLTCNGEDNCGDMSDELDCKHHTCSLGACSQLCIEKKEQLYSCKCHTGYHSQTYDHATHTCIAFGDPAKLIATGDSDLQILGAYKRGEDYHTELLYKNQTSSRFKIGHHDILWRPNEITIFATDQRHRRIFRLTVNMSSVNSQNLFSPSMDKQSNITIIVNNMTEPRGIAVEWISKRLYWTEAGGHPRGAILVSTLEGAMRTTLITGLYDPQDIVVDPKSKYMIWSRTGESPCIEKASLSGSSRKILVDRNIRWPIGLALDIPASRLYWSDPKTSTLESIKFDGTDRHLIKSFSFVEKPNKIVVFEDNIFYSTYFGQSIKKIDKFGKGNSSYLSHSLSEISDLSILQENLQDQNVTNYCDINPCSENALCLLSFESPGRSCICPDGWLANNKTHNSDLRCYIGSATFVSCSLRCTQGGRCEVADGVEKCSCFPGYTGLRCEQYRCARYCLHGGVCILRHDGSLECSCLRNWTGKRCEISKCKTCKSETNCTNECPCPPPYSGANCDICGDKKCTDGKVCQYQSDNSSLVCECPLGWTGHRCETSLCKGYCADDGYCKINEKGLPECHCPRGRAGELCEDILCKEVCKNKGVCHISGGSVVCACPAQYTGQHCEELLCLDDSCKTTTEEQPTMSPREGECRVNGAESYMCQNGGNCTKTFHSSVCRCPPQWGGPYCQIYIGHDNPCSNHCKNQAVCSVNVVAGPAHCHCLEGWRGDKCENKDLCWNWCHPDNGICSITALGEPKCTCMNDFGGPHCMESLQQIADEQTRRIWTGLGVSVILALLVIGAASALFMIYRRRGKSFSHSRLQDNIEINNPMYLQGHDEDLDPLDRGFNLNPDKNGGHFANPVYDSIYKGLGNADAASTTPLAESGPNLHVGLGADECSGLLQNTQESDPLS